jgi:flagellin-like protein
MHRRLPTRRGLAEIVGTLMLVLIVVSAAVAFSFFVASYQKSLQAEETQNQQRGLESLRILSIAPNLVPSGGTDWFPSLNFSLASEYINPSQVTAIAVNNNQVESYTVTALNLTTGSRETTPVPAAAYMILYPREQATIWINFSGTSNPSSFYAPLTLLPTDFIKIDVYTQLQNDFSRVFLPPTALAAVSTIVIGGGNVVLMDGTGSFQPEGNVTLVSWGWFVNATGTTPTYSMTFAGEEYQIDPAPPAGPYDITLNVTNSDFLEASASLAYTSPGP